jgi:hypothetical protein
MALIRFGEGQQRSGSIGASVYSRNRSGAYIRARSVPVNPNTSRQVTIRNAVQSLTIGWNLDLTQAQRDAWTLYANNVNWTNHLGDSINLTGLNMYVRSNVPRLQIPIARVDDGPTIFDLAVPELVLGCTASEATQILSITFDDTATWASESGAAQLFYMGAPKNAGVAFFGGPYRLAASQLGVTPAASPVEPAAPFPFAEDQRIWIRSRISRADGRLSEFAEINFLAAA